jgi:glycosyltransferase involved in cell wall biosynthesis
VKKVLIITYYWPPQGGSGVQRWLKFVKYLREFGVEPVVYTPENPEMMAVDKALETEIPGGVKVLKRKITEPYTLYKIFTGKKEIKPGFINQKGGERKGSFKEGLSLFLRSNLFVPDPKMLWIGPSARYLKRYLKANPVDAIISTGPPHSMHLIAKRVSKSLSIPWIADFRDPWTGMYNFKSLKNTALTSFIHKRMEKSVLRSAGSVVVVTNGMKTEMENLGAKDVAVITNGFDEQDFSGTDIILDNKFTISYTGLFFRDRNPSYLWKVLGEMVTEDREFAGDLQIRLVGNIDSAIAGEVRSAGLENNLELHSYMSHNKVIDIQRQAQILLLSSGMEPESKSILTGKFFEYLAARRPILAFGYGDSDIAAALNETESGRLFEYGEVNGLSDWIKERYSEYKNGGIPPTDGKIARFSRRSLTGDIVKIIDKLTVKTK